MKKCFKCSQEKPLSDFYNHKDMADGRVNKCKSCNKKDVQDNYRANIGHYKEYERSRAILPHRVLAREEYEKTEEGKASTAKAKRKWAKRNPIKRMASHVVNNAVRDGKIIKPCNCSDCNSEPTRLHGHHDDYAYPLVVRWLCPGCHNKWHKLNGEGLNSGF